MAQNPVVFVALLLPLTRVKTRLKGTTNFNLKVFCKTHYTQTHILRLTLSHLKFLRSTFCTLANLESFVKCFSSNVRMLVMAKYGYWYVFCSNCYAYEEWPKLRPLFAWVCDFENVRFSESMAQSRIHRKNTHIANSSAILKP